jgi:hypothetical protein
MPNIAFRLGALTVLALLLTLAVGAASGAPLPQCGGVEEDSQDCSREGRQTGVPGGWR